MVSWLQSIDPTLPKHLHDQGIALETVEQKYREACFLPFPHRHRMAVPAHVDSPVPRFRLRIDFRCV